MPTDLYLLLTTRTEKERTGFSTLVCFLIEMGTKYEDKIKAEQDLVEEQKAELIMKAIKGEANE